MHILGENLPRMDYKINTRNWNSNIFCLVSRIYHLHCFEKVWDQISIMYLNVCCFLMFFGCLDIVP